MRRLFCPFLAAAVIAVAVLGGVDRASAAIRISISDGTTDKVYYSDSSTAALFATDIGAFDVMLQTTASNFPGLASGGTLSNTIIVSDDVDLTGTVLPTLTVTAAVIDNVAGLSSGFVTGATRTTVEAQSLATFTLPSGSFLSVSSDIGSMVSNTATAGGTVQNTTTVNATVVPSLEAAVNSHLDANVTAPLNAPAGYTLSSQVVFSGGTVGVSGLVITATSGVSSLSPEPASMVVWGLGAVGLAVAAVGRRFRRAST